MYLQSAFRDSQVEPDVKPIAPTIDSTERTQTSKTHTRNTFELSNPLDIAQQTDKPFPFPGIQNKGNGNNNFWYIDGTDNPTPPDDSGSTYGPMPSSKPTLPNNSTPTSNPNTTNNASNKTNLSESNALLEEHINKNYAWRKKLCEFGKL